MLEKVNLRQDCVGENLEDQAKRRPLQSSRLGVAREYFERRESTTFSKDEVSSEDMLYSIATPTADLSTARPRRETERKRKKEERREEIDESKTKLLSSSILLERRLAERQQ